MNRKRLTGLMVALTLVLTQVFTVFAAGSSSANPIREDTASEKTVVTPGQEVYIEAKKDKDAATPVTNLIVVVTSNGNVVDATMDTKVLIEAINKVNSGAKSAKLPTKKSQLVTQPGSVFKGWYINGKRVKKLTAKMLQQLSDGTLKLEARFKEKKYKAKSVKISGQVFNLGTLVYASNVAENPTYLKMVEAAKQEAKALGKTFVGFASSKANAAAGIADYTIAITPPEGKGFDRTKKTVKLIPVYK